MSTIEKHIPFVKQQLAFQQKMADEALNTFRKKFHEDLVAKFKALLADLIAVDALVDHGGGEAPLSGESKPTRPRLTLLPEDIEGLPEELRKELSIDADKTEFAILNLIEEAGGIVSLDQLLIGLYKKTGEVHKRQSLTSRLYRMAQKEQVFSVPGKKGVYSSRALTEEQAERMTGEPS